MEETVGVAERSLQLFERAGTLPAAAVARALGLPDLVTAEEAAREKERRSHDPD